MPQKSTRLRKWTAEEDELLRQLCPALPQAEIVAKVGRSINAVRSRCSILGAAKRTFWTDEEKQVVRDWYEARRGGRLDLDELALLLGRSRCRISLIAREMGLTDPRRPLVERDEDGLRPCDRKRRAKFVDPEERRAHLSRIRKAYLATHDHPRGALGMKHSDQAKQVLANKSRERWQALSPDQKQAMYDKRRETNLAKYGTTNPAILGVHEPYSRSRGGKRADLGDTYYRSAWEANYARYLNWLVEQGEIAGWVYEADVFVFHGETRGAITYRPDFKVTERDGSVVYHEVKGWMDGPSKTRLKRMAKHYPDVKVIVIGEAEYRALARWKALIPEWEGNG